MAHYSLSLSFVFIDSFIHLFIYLFFLGPVMLDEYVSWCRENNKTKQKEEEKESGEEE